ncbi:hypothetical protein HPB52_002061 [Rhipicephalus sanguineus]|uniref:Uncharacterized protein n=1 Tax=Rhipicephalus sanguineus TaxID=34632 RepID=A0A9D4PHJ7_RHISA|nr:hypothetical protein HPB52_002061 [Rhipicephalus sanguineus]
MRAQVPPPAAVSKNNPPAVALRPLDAEPVPPLGPKEPAAVFPDAPPPAAPGHRDTSAAGDQGGGMMGNFGGGISPGSLEGISRLRLCMYVMGAMAVLLLLFAVYAYAMFDDSGEPRAVPGVDTASGLGGNGDR